MFLAVAALPSDPQALAQAALLTGLTRVDLRTRLAGTLPRVLVRSMAEAEVPGLLTGLEALGFKPFAADAGRIPSDDQRLVLRSLSWTDGGFHATDGRGRVHDVQGADLALLQWGSRLRTATDSVTTTERKLALGKALLTGGLAVTKQVVTTTDRSTATKEAFLLIERSPGHPDLIVYERHFRYDCLGAEILPSQYRNLVQLQTLLRARFPGVPTDDRASQPAFTAGLPALGADPADLATFLVSQARRLQG